MTLLSREAILGVDDTHTERVDVPEWGGYVFVKTLSSDERDIFESDIIQGPSKEGEHNLKQMRSRLAVLTVVDADDVHLFTMDDVTVLGAKSAKAMDRVYAVAQRLSGISDDDLEALAENLEKGPASD